MLLSGIGYKHKQNVHQSVLLFTFLFAWGRCLLDSMSLCVLNACGFRTFVLWSQHMGDCLCLLVYVIV